MSEQESYHQVIFRQMHERIEVVYLKACEQKLADPVVVILDLNDPLGERIIEQVGRGVDRLATIAEAERRGVQPIGVWHIPGDFGMRLFKNSGHDEVADCIQSAIAVPKAFPVVIVAGRMLSVVACPVPTQ